MRLIDADALMDAMHDHEFQTFCPLDEVDGVINDAPTIEAEPVKRGEWKVTDAWPHKVYCSNCHVTLGKSLEIGDVEAEQVMRPNRCPNCGAHMKEE